MAAVGGYLCGDCGGELGESVRVGWGATRRVRGAFVRGGGVGDGCVGPLGDGGFVGGGVFGVWGDAGVVDCWLCVE